MYPYERLEANYRYSFDGRDDDDDRVIAIQRVRYDRDALTGEVSRTIVDHIASLTILDASELMASLAGTVKVQLAIAVRA